MKSLISKLFFVVGAERSGSTMFSLMLRNHHQIAFLPTFAYAVSQISEKGEFPPLKEYYKYLESESEIMFPKDEFIIDYNLSYLELINSFLSQWQEKYNRPLIGARVQYSCNKLSYLYPDAKYIHLLRDGRDVARSWIGMGWAGNVWRGSQGWEEAEVDWDNLRKQIAEEQWLNVRYEELILEPEKKLREICDFLEISYDPEMLRAGEIKPNQKLLKLKKNI